MLDIFPSHWKLQWEFDCGLCSIFPDFFLKIDELSPCLYQLHLLLVLMLSTFIWEIFRPSQIVWTVMTTCMRTLYTHRNLLVLLIPLSKDNLNLPTSFFLPCAWLPPSSIVLSYLLPWFAALAFLFASFHRS